MQKNNPQYPNKLTIVNKECLTERPHGYFGVAYGDEGVIEIDPRQAPKDYLDTLIHESLHIVFKEWSEEEVYDLSQFLSSTLWDNGYRKIHQEDDTTVYGVEPGGEIPTPKTKGLKVNPPTKTTVYSRIKDEYTALFNACEIRSPYKTKEIVKKIAQNRSLYEEVGMAPWYWIGCIHMMESNLNFKTHLHNGDPLRHRTKNIPRGRPAANPDTINGYSWEFSAKDALAIKKIDQWRDWSIAGMLYQAEQYNGWGYRLYKSNHSPYLWSGSQIWLKGKYVADNKYNPNATSSQIGVGVLLKEMHNQGIFE